MDNKTIVKLLIDPYPKPRMTQRDKWAKRKCVVEYFRWKDKLNAMVTCDIPPQFKITFTVPMPSSWGKKKRKQMAGQPHQKRPDLDNFLKAFLDAIFEEDGHIWNVHAVKVWGEEGAILVEAL